VYFVLFMVCSENSYLVIMCNLIIFWSKSMVEIGDVQIIIYVIMSYTMFNPLYLYKRISLN
jgi:ABC-type sulfate transport system permease component